jgi:hypothetical protein
MDELALRAPRFLLLTHGAANIPEGKIEDAGELSVASRAALINSRSPAPRPRMMI